MTNTLKKIGLLLLLPLILMAGCEDEIILDVPFDKDQIVVEGYIENGAPPYVLLTRNFPYFGTLDSNFISGIFVDSAKVTVSDGDQTIVLDEFSFGSGEVQAVIYTTFAMVGQEGKTYTLRIERDDQVITAETTIPVAPTIDSVWFELVDSTNSPFPIEEDNLMRCFVSFTDVAGQKDYYRYMTSRGDRDFIAPDNSAFDIVSLDGEVFNGVFLSAPSYPDDTLSFSFFYRTGDTVGVKWCGIDQGHFDFWETFYQNIDGFGPFTNPTVVKSNIEGGLGNWGGQGCTTYTDFIAQ